MPEPGTFWDNAPPPPREQDEGGTFWAQQREPRVVQLDPIEISGSPSGYMDEDRPYGEDVSTLDRLRYGAGEVGRAITDPTSAAPGAPRVGHQVMRGEALAAGVGRGVVDAARNVVGSLGFGTSTGDVSALDRLSREQAPDIHATGRAVAPTAASFAVPVARAAQGAGVLARTAAGVGTGLGQGTAISALSSQDHTAAGVTRAGIEGGLAGAALPLAGGAIQGTARGVGSALRSTGLGAGSTAGAARLAAAGAGVGDVRRAYRNYQGSGGLRALGEQLRAGGVGGAYGLGTREQHGVTALAMRERAGREIAQVLDDHGAAPVSRAELVRGVEGALESFSGSNLDVERAGAEQIRSTVRNMLSTDARPTFARLQELKEDLGRLANYERVGGRPTATQAAADRAYGAVRELMDEVADRSGVDTAAYQAARRNYRAASTAVDAAQVAANRDAARLPMSLPEIGVGGAVFASGVGTVPALAAAAGYKYLVRPRQYAIAATASERLAGLARTNPEQLGRFAQPILDALQRGPQALAARSFVLSQNDPEYRQLIERLEQQDDQQEPEQ